MKAANGNVVKDYDLIKPLPPDGTFFMHLPGVYCANCGETFALYSFSHFWPGQVDANGKPFYSHCFKCRPKSHNFATMNEFDQWRAGYGTRTIGEEIAYHNELEARFPEQKQFWQREELKELERLDSLLMETRTSRK